MNKGQSSVQKTDLLLQESNKKADAAEALLSRKQVQFEDKLQEERESTMKAEVTTSMQNFY